MLKTRRLLIISILSTMAFILMVFDFPLPFLPPFLKLDFSDVPVVIIALIFGPIAALATSLLKSSLYFMLISHEPVGVVASFLASIILTLGFYYTIKMSKNKGQYILLSIVTISSLVLVMVLMNYFVLLPMYSMITNLSNLTDNMKVIISAGIVPFNLIKGVISIIVFTLAYYKVYPILYKHRRDC